MPPKVLELLYEFLAFEPVTEIRLLSGGQNLVGSTLELVSRFKSELDSKHGIGMEWRVLEKVQAQRHHDRLFVSDSGAFNVPPINSRLIDQTSEVSPSALDVEVFDGWWLEGSPDPSQARGRA